MWKVGVRKQASRVYQFQNICDGAGVSRYVRMWYEAMRRGG